MLCERKKGNSLQKRSTIETSIKGFKKASITDQKEWLPISIKGRHENTLSSL
jgi:hypothetical protein